MTNTTIITALNIERFDSIRLLDDDGDFKRVSRVRRIDHQRLRIDTFDAEAIITHRDDEFEKETPLEP